MVDHLRNQSLQSRKRGHPQCWVPLEETGGCHSRGRLSLARGGGGTPRHGCDILKGVPVPPVGEIFLHVEITLRVPRDGRKTEMESFRVEVKRQLIHLPIHSPAAPTEIFYAGSPLPCFLTVSAYFAKVYKFSPMTDTIKIEIPAVTRVTPFRRFPTTNNHKRRVLHSECTVGEILAFSVTGRESSEKITISNPYTMTGRNCFQKHSQNAGSVIKCFKFVNIQFCFNSAPASHIIWIC